MSQNQRQSAPLTPEQEEEKYIKTLEVQAYKIRRTPEHYVAEVTRYKDDFITYFTQAKESPLQKNAKAAELAVFLARMAPSFRKDLAFVDNHIQEFLTHYANQMNPFLRKKFVAAHMIMRSQNLIGAFESVRFLFQLLACQSKELRRHVQQYIVKDLRRANRSHKNQRLNKQVQIFLHELVLKQSTKVTKIGLQIAVALYKKHVWCDPKTVNIIAAGCFNPYHKVKLVAAYFLLETTFKKEDGEGENSSDDASDSDKEDAFTANSRALNTFSKKTKSRVKRLEREKARAARKQQRKLDRAPTTQSNFFPIDVLYNPQDFGERLFAELRKSSDKFEVKLVLMAVLARLIGRHKLIILSFYSYLQKYLMPHQRDISKILAFLAESTHQLVPAEDLEPIIKQLIDNFVNERCSEEAMTMGLNTVREMCSRNKLAVDEFHVNYLAGFYKYRNPNVSKAAKSVINLFREINPQLLEKKFRGRELVAGADTVLYHRENVKSYVEGADLLDHFYHSNLPIAVDRILTDEDFKKIRYLRQKKAEEEEEEQQEHNYGQVGDDDDDDTEDVEDDEQGVEEEQLDVSEDEEDGDVEDEEDDDVGDEENDDVGDEEDDDVEDEDDHDVEDEEDDDVGGEEDDSDDEQNQSDDKQNRSDDQEENQQDQEIEKAPKQQYQKSRQLKQQNKERRQDEDDLLDDIDMPSSQDFEEDDDPNPHNFVDAEELTKFRQTKSERRKLEKEARVGQVKPRWYQGPKQKGGGTTNEQKIKQKPMQMLRPKKNREVFAPKRNIKHIKTQLGHVRSKKQFKQRKSRRIG